MPDLSLTLAGRRWRIDPDRLVISFRFRWIFGLRNIRARFHDFAGGLDLEDEPLASFTIEAETLTTDGYGRDRRLRSASFFDVATHPYIQFESDTAEIKGDQLSLTGSLTVAGVTTPLIISARLRPVGSELHIDAAGNVDRRLFGGRHGYPAALRPAVRLELCGRLVPRFRGFAVDNAPNRRPTVHSDPNG